MLTCNQPASLMHTNRACEQVKAKLMAGGGSSSSGKFALLVEEFLDGYTRCAVKAGIPADTFKFNLGTLAQLLPEALTKPYQVNGLPTVAQ
jgi:hypothetical protein